MKQYRVIGLIMALVFGAALLSAAPVPVASAAEFVTIGTGGVTGVYYPTGGAIAKIVNEKRDVYNIRATVEATGGSVFNVNAVSQGDLEFGVVQSDRQYQAINGLAEWKGAPKKNLRAVFSIHPETFFIVASEASGIKKFTDLKGKRVAVGNPGSGQRQNFLDILEMYGMKHADFAAAEDLKPAESPKMLQDGRIDAFIYTVGNPAGMIKESTAGAQKVRFIPIDDDKMDMLIKKYPYYVKAKIPMSFYEQALNKEDVPTFAVKATFVTSSEVPEKVVYAVTKEIFDNLDKFKALHEAFSGLAKEEMVQGLSAPLHPGAQKYFKEAGLLK